jgi:hypothetical protein
MPRRNNIRIKDKDIDLIESLEKRVKKKKSNIYSRYRQRVDIEPKKITDFQTREQLNKYVREMNRFLDRSNPEYRFTRTEAGVTLRQDTLGEIQKLIKKVNKTKDVQFEKYKHLPFLIDKKPTDMSVKQYHEVVKNRNFEQFRHLKFDPNRFRTEHEAQVYLENLRKAYKGNWWQKEAREYKENYIKGLEKQFAGIPQLPQLIKKVQKTPIKKLLELQYTTDEGKIKFMYEPLETNFIFKKIMELF